MRGPSEDVGVMNAGPPVVVIRGTYMSAVTPQLPRRRRCDGKGTYAALVLTLLSGAIGLSLYDLYVLITLTVGT